MPEPETIESIPYITPHAFQEDANVWCEGNLLFIRGYVELPERCVKCNAPATARWQRKLSWHSPFLFFLIVFPGLLIYALVALIIRKSQKVDVGLCTVHNGQRCKAVMVAWMIAVGSVVLLIVAIILSGERSLRDTMIPAGMIVLGIVGILGGLLYGVIRSQVLSPKRIERDLGQYKGAGAEFLASLDA